MSLKKHWIPVGVHPRAGGDGSDGKKKFFLIRTEFLPV